MITLDQQINRLEDIPGITPRLAYLIKLQFLEIESQADNDEIDAWLPQGSSKRIVRLIDSNYRIFLSLPVNAS